MRVCVTESSAVWSRGPALSETARQRYSRITADIWADWDSLKTCPYCWDWYNEINRCGGGHTHTSRHLTDAPRDVCHAQRHSRGSTNFSDAQIYTNCMHTLKHISTPNDPQLFMCTDTIAKPCQTHFSHKHSIQTQTTPKPSKIDNSTGSSSSGQAYPYRLLFQLSGSHFTFSDCNPSPTALFLPTAPRRSP